MKDDQFVSIGMPVFNDKLFIRKAIESLLKQTYTNFELIISDDNSTDGSKEICLEYAKKDKRIRYIRQDKNIGISRNMMFLLSQAVGHYFMWAANDDMWHPEFIKLLKDDLDKSEDAIMAFPSYFDIDENDKKIGEDGIIKINYAGKNSYIRLKKFISEFKDACGYALFKREKILDVEIPVWWWVNRTRAFNNIYPSITYYLAKGNYVLYENKPLWFHRVKDTEHINHKVPYPSSFLRSYIAFFLWKFNLVYNSLKQIKKGSNSLKVSVLISPLLLCKWWIKPSFTAFFYRLNLLIKKKVTFW